MTCASQGNILSKIIIHVLLISKYTNGFKRIDFLLSFSGISLFNISVVPLVRAP